MRREYARAREGEAKAVLALGAIPSLGRPAGLGACRRPRGGDTGRNHARIFANRAPPTSSNAPENTFLDSPRSRPAGPTPARRRARRRRGARLPAGAQAWRARDAGAILAAYIGRF